MDDDDYVWALWAILTNPEPTGIDPSDPYGMADDGIDRYDGFGSEVLVESLDVVGGDHGAELLVTFALRVPTDHPALKLVPAQGAARLPFDREWRHLSGYDDPAAYAPEVASVVMRAARDHVARHRKGADSANAREVPEREVQWRMLLEALTAELDASRVSEVAPGRIELEVASGERDEGTVVTVVVTPEQWEEVLTTEAGDDVDLYVTELLASREEDERFVVFYDGDLVRSTREELPPVRGRAFSRRMAELRGSDLGAGGDWRASPPHESNGERQQGK